MNESKFEELVNLYFDQEISADELKCLKEELAASVDRRREFEVYYRLHQATCSALSKGEQRVSRQTAPESLCANRLTYNPSIAFGLGIAACLLILLTPTFLLMRNFPSNMDTNIAETTDSLVEGYDTVDQETAALPARVSPASELRLAGLATDVAPSDQKFSHVQTEVLQQREVRLQDMIKQMDQYKAYSALSEPHYIEPTVRSYEAFNDSTRWPDGFNSSLASFKPPRE